MKFSVHKPKLNRSLIRDISNKKIGISKAALNLLFVLTPYIDYDSRIHMDEYHIRRKLVWDRRTLKKSLNELCTITYNGKKLFTYENGVYYSGFHLASSGEITYLKHLPIYNNSVFHNLTLNQSRLFLYVSTLNIRNQYTKVAVENLYKNKLHDKQYGMHVYDDYQTMVEDLFLLIDLGLIHVRLPGEKYALKYDENPEYKNLFHDICGFKNEKKSRTSKYYKKKHSIGLKVNPELFQEKSTHNTASEYEFRLLADRYHMYHEDINQETINFFIGKKNKMISQFKESGMEIYRSSLEKYFKEKHEDIVYYDLCGKAENYFSDFYLFEEIKKVILGGIRTDLGEKGAIAAVGYSFTHTDIPLLVEFFVANSSDEHKVLFDQDVQLIHRFYELLETTSRANHWTSLKESINVVYETYTPVVRNIIKELCKEHGIANSVKILSEIDIKNFIISSAQSSQLSKRKVSDEQAQKLKQMVLFFRKKQIPVKLKLQEDETPNDQQICHKRREELYYNWLEEDAN